MKREVLIMLKHIFIFILNFSKTQKIVQFLEFNINKVTKNYEPN